MSRVVCEKQGFDTADIKWTKRNTIKRKDCESIMNPFGGYALETIL